MPTTTPLTILLLALLAGPPLLPGAEAVSTSGPLGMGVFGDQIAADEALPAVEHLELVLTRQETTGKDQSRAAEVLTVHLYRRAQRISAGYGRSSLDHLVRKLHASELVQEDGALSGRLVELSYRGENPPPQIAATYQLDLRQQGSGTLAGTWSGRGDAWQASGTITGRVVPEAELTSAERSLRSGADWPCWRGPYGNGTAAAAERSLVRDWQEARLVWKSEAFVWALAGKEVMQSHNSPVLGDGLVFMHNTEPNMEGPFTRPPSRAVDGKMKHCTFYPESFTKRLTFTCFFDDIVHAIDARTGATVWKRRWPRSGLYDSGKNKNGLFSTPVFHDGRLFVQRLMGMLTCLDARSGETLWETSLDPERSARWQEQMPLLVAGKKPFHELWSSRDGGPGGDEPQVSHTTAGGLLICVLPYGRGLAALDPASGKEVWRLEEKGLLGGYASPVRWVHDGRDHVLTGNALIDPASGRLSWRIPGSFGAGPTANERYLLCHHPFAIWRISPAGAEPAWTLEPSAEELATWKAAGGGGNNSECKPYGNVDWSSGATAGDAFVLTARRGASWTVQRGADGAWQARRYGLDFAPEVTMTGSAIASGGLLLCPGESRIATMYLWNAADGELRIPGSALDNGGRRYGSSIGNLDTDNAMCTSPILVDGRLFGRGQDGIVCYDLRVAAGGSIR